MTRLLHFTSTFSEILNLFLAGQVVQKGFIFFFYLELYFFLTVIVRTVEEVSAIAALRTAH